MLKHLDLFSGIGGFALGLQRAGFETIGFCEIDIYCQKILAKRFPNIPIYNDVRNLDGSTIQADIITGGYPCQPFSLAGNRDGEEDDRHLWPQMLRTIKAIRPTWVICENVYGHITLGLDTVLSELESADYTCIPLVVPACAVGAPHFRERVWIIAHTIGERYREQPEQQFKQGKTKEFVNKSGSTANANSERYREPFHELCPGWETLERSYQDWLTAHNRRLRGKGSKQETLPGFRRFSWSKNIRGIEKIIRRAQLFTPLLCRARNELPNQVDRLRGLGNAIVPDIVEIFGQLILYIEDQKNDR